MANLDATRLHFAYKISEKLKWLIMFNISQDLGKNRYWYSFSSRELNI